MRIRTVEYVSWDYAGEVSNREGIVVDTRTISRNYRDFYTQYLVKLDGEEEETWFSSGDLIMLNPL